MNAPKTRLEYLFGRYYDRTATSTELEELAVLLNLADDETLSDVMQKKWNDEQATAQIFSTAQSDQMMANILNSGQSEVPAVKMGRTWIKYVAAAAVLVIVGIGTVFFLKPGSKNDQEKIANAATLNDILPGGNKATLTLSTGKTIVLDLAKNGVLMNEGNILVKKAADGQVVYQNSNQANSSATLYNVLTTPKGGQYQLVLPDGSKAWLNAASSIKFPAAFTGTRREVELSGEAYFEIEKNPSKPFIVKSRLGDVEVLGTHFNVMAYSDEASMKTTLLEGSVKISSKRSSSLLKPGQQADLNKDGAIRVLSNINTDKEIAWKNGLFYFDDADIELVMRQASRWYNIGVSYEGNIPAKRLTGKISRNVKATELLNILKYSGINFKLKNGQLIVTN